MLTILYVDDEPDLLELGKIYLERNGEFLVISPPRHPRQSSTSNRKNTMRFIADYQMPEMDGIQLLKHIRRTNSGDSFHPLHRERAGGDCHPGAE